MKINILEIIQSYAAKWNPSEERKALAEKRLAICNQCEFPIGDSEITKRCGKCGCFLSGKVFSPRENACPEGKWNSVDFEYFEKKRQKGLRERRLI